MKTIPPLADLLVIDDRDRRGLEWTRSRARYWLTAIRRRRKHLLQGKPCSPEEVAANRAPMALQDAASHMLGSG